MAAKYMGAKRLAKEKAKMKELDEKLKLKGKVHANAGDYLDRRKQKFDMSQSSMQAGGDFEIEDDEEEVNQEFNRVYEELKKKDTVYFLTSNEIYIEN